MVRTDHKYELMDAMFYRTAPLAMILSDPEGHFSDCKHFKCMSPTIMHIISAALFHNSTGVDSCMRCDQNNADNTGWFSVVLQITRRHRSLTTTGGDLVATRRTVTVRIVVGDAVETLDVDDMYALSAAAAALMTAGWTENNLTHGGSNAVCTTQRYSVEHI